ncbi:MAG: DUF2141 domain-containing protein [Parvularculaceae bacterium]|nr:DUF2141 domain-containing protein [Parvularculaceae bacterium]
MAARALTIFAMAIVALAMGALPLGGGAAFADSAPMPNPFSKYSTAEGAVLAVRSEFAPVGGRVRITVYDGEANFLEMAAAKLEGEVNEDGVALVTFYGAKPGVYAFVAYFDENGDGKLNRSFIGKPKEPYVFSNDIRPKMRKPTFNETKVAIAPGEVVVLTLKD